MRWSKGTAVKGAKGFVWLAGTEGLDPETGKPVEGAEAQARLCWEKIKSWLEEFGTSLDNIVKIVNYVVGPFPDGVTNCETWKAAFKVREEYFKKYAPDLCWDSNPVPNDLIGVAGLGKKGMLIEVAVVAAIPDD